MSDVRIHDELLRWEFENSDFEKKAAQTLTTLQKLEKALNFKTVIDLARNFKLDGLAKDVDQVTASFTKLGKMGTQVLKNLTDDAYKAGKKFVSAITIDDAKMGFNKYEEQVGAVQTLMNTTGLTAKEIQKYVDKFAIYSDETSYSLDQMVKAFSQMTTVADLSGTAADKATELKKIQDMIIGIANASAFAGKTGQEFQRTIYNITQSYQTGALKLMDWKSLQMAGTASKQLMEEMIKAGEDLYKQSKGKNGFKEGTVTVQNFSEVLKKGVISAEVMENAFGKFGELAVAAAEGVQEGKYENFADAVEKLGDNFSELSRKATESAWSAKTFREAIASIHDTISTQWSKSYQLIIGDYEEARVLWTNVAEALYDIFAGAGIERNKVLQEWNDNQGRYYLVSSLQNIVNSILSFVNPIKEAWRSVFTPLSGRELTMLTVKLANFTHGLILSGETQGKLRSITKDFATVLKNLLTIFKNFAKPILDIIGPFDKLAQKALIVLKVISLFTKALTEATLKSEKATKVVGALMAALAFKRFMPKSIKLIFALAGGIKLVGIAAAAVLGILAASKIRKLFSEGGRIRTELDKIRSGFQKLRDTAKSFDTWKLEDYVNAVKNIASNIKNAAFDKLGNIGNFFKSIDWKSILPTNISAPIDNVVDKFTNLKRVIYNLSQSIQAGKLTLMDWKSIQFAGFGKEGWKPFYEGIVKAGVYINKFRDIAKNGFGLATTSIKNLFSKDTFTGFSPFESMLNRIKDMFTSREGFINGLDEVRHRFKNLAFAATAPWKVSAKYMDLLKSRLGGLPKLIFNISSSFKDFLTGLKNPEAIKSFARTVTDTFGEIGSKVFSGIDILTKGDFHDVLAKIAKAFSSIRDNAAKIGSKGLDTFYSVLSKLYSLFASSGSTLSGGASRIKDILTMLDVRIGAFGARLISTAKRIKDAIPELISPIFKIVDTLKGGRYSKVLDLGKSIFTDLGKTISSLGGGGFKQFTTSLKTLFDTFASGAPLTKTIERLKDAISSFFNIFKKTTKSASIEEAIPVRGVAAQTNAFVDTLTSFKERVTYVVDGIRTVAHKINDIIPPELGRNIIKFVGVVAQLVVMKKVAKVLKQSFVDIATGVKNGAEGVQTIFAPFKALAEGIPNIFTPFKALADGITNLSATLSTAIDSFMNTLRGKWKAEAFESRANGIFKIASAVAVLASAVWVVAQIPIDKGQLWQAVGALGVLMGALLGFAMVFDKLGQSWLTELPKLESIASKLAGSLFYFGKSSMIASLAVSMIAMAGAVKMLMEPVKQMSKMGWKEFVSGLLKVGAIMLLLGSIVGKLGSSVKGAGPGIIAATGLLWIFNRILRDFLVTMAMFGEMFTGQDWKKVAVGAAAVITTIGITMGGIVLIANSLSKFTASAKYVGGKVNPAAKALLATGALLAGIVFFLNSMSNVIKKFRKLRVKASEIGLTIIAIAGILSGIALYAKILKTAHLTDDIKTAGKLMIGFAGSFALVGLALHMFSNLDMEGVANALPAIIGAVITMLGVIAALGHVGKGVTLGSGVAILGFAALLTSLSVSLMILTLVDYAKLENASTSLAKVLLSLGVSLGIASGFTAKATAIIAFSFVIKELTTSLLFLSFIDYTKLESAANNLSKILLSVGFTMAMSGYMANTGILKWIGIITLIGALVGSLIALQDINVGQLKGVATALGGLEVVSGIVALLSSLGTATGGKAFASLAGATLLVGGIAGLLYIAGQIPDPENASRLMNSASAFLLTTGVVIAILGSVPWTAGIQAALLVISFFGILALAIGAVAFTLGSDSKPIIAGVDRLEKGFTRIGNFIGDIATGFITTVVEKAGDSLDKITQFLESIKPLKDILAESDMAGIGRALGIAKDILSLDIPNDGGLAGFIFGNNNIGDFGSDIIHFGSGLKLFSNSIKGIEATDEDIQKAISMSRGLVDLANAIPDSGDSLKSALVGVKDLGEFASQIAGGSFSGGASSINGDHGGSGRTFSTVIEGAAKSNRGLGGAIRLFTDSVKDIPEDAWKSANKAIKAAESIADFAQHVPKSGGLVQKIAGAHDLAKFALSLVGDGTDGNPGFITSMNRLVTESNAMGDPSSVVTKIQATQPLIDFFKQNGSAWDQLVTSLGNYDNYNSLAQTIEVLCEYARQLAFLQQYDYLDAGKLTNITNAITATEGAVTFFQDHTGVFESASSWIQKHLDAGDNPLTKCVNALKEYAHDLALLSAYDYIDTGKLTSMAEAFNASTGLLKFYNENTSVIESVSAFVRRFFDGDENPLADAIEKLIPYAHSLRKYSSIVAGIKDMDKVVRSTVAAGNFATAIQGLFSAQNLTQSDSFGYLTSFTGKLEGLGESIKTFGEKFGNINLESAASNVGLLVDMLNDMSGIGPLTADGFVTSINDLANSALTEFYSKFKDSNKEVNIAISDFLTNVVGSLSSTSNQDRVRTGATNLYKGFIDGQKKSLDEAKQDLEKFFKELPSAIDINESVFINLGMKIPYSIVKGIQNGTPLVVKAVEKMQDAGVEAGGESIHDDAWDSFKTDIAGVWKNLGLKIPFSSAKGVEEGTPFFTGAVTNLYQSGLNTFQDLFGENGSFLGNARTSISGMFGSLKGMLTGSFEDFTGVKLDEIFKDVFVSDGDQNGFVNFVEGIYKKLVDTGKDAGDEAVTNAKSAANDVSDATGKAGSKAVQDAKEAGKEILEQEDAFWVALLAKKRAGANAAEYQDMKVKDFEKKILEEVNKLVDDYKEKLNSTTDDILGMISLFDKVEDKAEEAGETFGDIFKGIGDKTTKLEGNIEDLFRRVDTVTKSDTVPVSGDELMANLQDQIDKYTEYYDIQDNLAKRINNNKLKKTLREMTIDSIEELKALNSMSDKELDKYVDLFNKRLEVASRDKAKQDSEESPTAELLTQNLEDQVEKYREYKEVVSNLNARVTSKKLKETLNGMGIDNMDQLKAIESMTDSELSHYTELFDEKYSLSRDVAEIRLEETKQETEDKLNELLETTGLQLDTFLTQFDGTLASLTDIMGKHLDSLSLQSAVGHMAQELVKILLDIFNNAGITTEQKIAEITKAIETAAALGVDLTDQYSQGIQAILANTEMTADEKLQGILQLMTQSQLSLAQTSENLAQTTKDTIAKILSNAEASKLVNALIGTLNDGVSSAQEKIEKFKIAIQQAGENNVQLTEVYRTQINQLLADTTMSADAQIAALLQLLQNATAEYQNWALQDISLLSQDLFSMSQVAQTSIGGSAKASHDIIKDKLRQTTEASEDELEEMTVNVESTLDRMTSSALSSQEAFSNAVQGIVTANSNASKQQAQDAADALESIYTSMSVAQSRAYASAGGGSSRSRNASSGKDRDAISLWESATGRTLSDAHRQFAMNGGTIVGGGGSQIIKDGRYWDDVNHASYDLASGAAHYAVQGYSDGISNGQRVIYAAGAQVYKAFSDGLTGPDALDEHSPSKRMMEFAKFALLGWLDGVDNYSHLMSLSGQHTADSYIDVFNESMRNIEMPPDLSPVITPVIDMSRAEDAMNAIDNLFNTEKSYSMASDIKRVADIAARAKAEASKAPQQAAPQTTNMNFTQNNYSPKALSKLDIYRQTKNQFAQMKGALA